MYHINCGKESGRNTDAATAEYPDNVLFWRPGENGRFYVTDTDFFIFIGGSTMRNKKGFTLVELVIVIAVIAILAGVMIGTFASVVKKAKESAKMQEMTAQKQEQIANDIDAKLKNAEWLGWSDFETKLAEAVSKAVGKGTWDKDQKENMVAAMKEAVDKALAEYAANLGKDNTGLTEEQVKYIVETALDKKSYSGVTAEQVKAIVNSAVSGSSTLTKSQVQAIVDKSAGLTVAEVAAAINRATAENKTNLDTAIADIKVELGKVKGEIKDATLSEEDVDAILRKYITDGKAKGDFSWYDSSATKLTIDKAKASDQLTALSTLTSSGVTFAGVTITLPEGEIELDEKDWQPIGQGSYGSKGFCGKIVGNGATIKVPNYKVVTDPTGRNGFTLCYSTESENRLKEFIGYGFIDYLGKDGSISNLTIDYGTYTYAAPATKYATFGAVVGVLDGGTIEGVTVKGTINGYYRVGGIAGIATSGKISNCDVTGLTLTSTNGGLCNNDYVVAASCVANVDATFTLNDGTGDLKLEISDITDDENKLTVVTDSKDTSHIGFKAMVGYTSCRYTTKYTNLVVTFDKNVTVGATSDAGNTSYAAVGCLKSSVGNYSGKTMTIKASK